MRTANARLRWIRAVTGLRAPVGTPHAGAGPGTPPRARWILSTGMTLLCGVAVPPVFAQGLRDLVEAALDQRITQRVEISERPVRDALLELEKLTGLHFVLDDAAVEWLPYGEQTRLSLALDNVSVRQALSRIFDGLGLRLRVDGNDVVVEPGPVLDRLGRRLTLDEVTLLQHLAAQPWSALPVELRAVEFRLPPTPDPRAAFDRALAAAPAAAALAQLEAATAGLGWLWVPSGSTIVIYSRSEDIQQRLDRPLDLSYRRRALDELLLDLGRRIDVTIHFQPGALQRVAARERYVDLVLRQTTMRQILELLVGRTGLWYEVVEDGIVVGAAGKDEAARPSGEARVAAILRVPVGTDGTTIDFLIREDELPTEFRDLRARKLPQVVELLRAGSERPAP